MSKRANIDLNGDFSEKIRGTKSIRRDLLISAGVRLELTLKRTLNLQIDKGLQVDDRMRTGIQDIYAAGGLIEHRGRLYGIWPAAMEQGRVAGANLAGKETEYQGTVLPIL
jgi:nitrite reductase (NADH) large subunit